MAVRRDGRGRTRWGLVAALLAVPALLVLVPFAWFVWAFATSDFPLGGGKEDVSCEEALHFGGAQLPAGAYDTDCERQSWMDTYYGGTFRMPRAGVRDWLATLSPQGPQPGATGCDHGADLCLNLDAADSVLPPGAAAAAVTVNVTYENATTARVRWSAFTM
ncbi:hypothetical protein [Streptomyces griseosporeus]|uniref:hypothetical protein n=1 Tax=Streptomyces griseosporeus TaxID=1910 RepID=UPI0037B666EC